jgi:hypothetical protein
MHACMQVCSGYPELVVTGGDGPTRSGAIRRRPIRALSIISDLSYFADTDPPFEARLFETRILLLRASERSYIDRAT